MKDNKDQSNQDIRMKSLFAKTKGSSIYQVIIFLLFSIGLIHYVYSQKNIANNDLIRAKPIEAVR
jgi:hypothetical protein